ncbi:MAG: DUF523 domain-containing protein [Paeniclostridium sp.]
MILVSACLLGINCKYDGDNNNHEGVKNYLRDKQFILVCPEQLGGLLHQEIHLKLLHMEIKMGMMY